MYTVTSGAAQNFDNFESVLKIYEDIAILKQELFLFIAFVKILQ